MTAGGFALDWFYKQFCRELSQEEFYSHYLEHVLEKQSISSTVSFAPYLTGDRQSLTPKTGSWQGLTLSATREEMLSAMLRSMQSVLYNTVKLAKNTIPLDKIIKISGGIVTPAYLKLKEASFPGYQFQRVDHCPLLGNAALIAHQDRI